jgi:hypothetical protein
MSNRKRSVAVKDIEEQAIAVKLPELNGTAYPSHWTPGQLLDLKRFTDGSYQATILGEQVDHQTRNFVEFDSSYAAQAFVSTWYQPGKARVW